jgi:DUF4097 and DUF4098 domain-containing protein YvlB
MRAVMKILFILLGVGIIFVMIAVIFSPDWDIFANTFGNDDDYGDLITYTEDEVITDLKLELENRHIEINYVDEEVLTIEYYKHENDTFEFNIVDGMLTMTHDFDSFWLNIFSFNIASRTVITVHVNIPESWILDTLDLKTMTGDIDMTFDNTKTYDEVKLFNHTGDMHIENINVSRLNAHTSTGDINMSDIQASESFIVEVSTGDMTLSRIDTDTFDIQSSTGDIVLSSITATDGDVNVSTGDITISSSTFDQLAVNVSTGKINLNNVISNSYLLESSTGDISVTVSSLDDLRFDLETDFGKIKIDGQSQGDEYQSFTGTIDFIVNTNTGDITIEVDA